MAGTPWTPTEKKTATDMRRSGATYTAIAAATGRSWASVSQFMQNQGIKAKRQPIPKPPVEEPESDREGIDIRGDDNSLALTCVSRTIRTLKDALAEAAVDLETWDVDDYTINKWDSASKNEDGKIQVVELWQVKARLKRKVAYSFETAINSAIKTLSKSAPKWAAFKPKKIADPLMVEVSLADLHFGKLCWAPETGTNYDLKIANRVYRNAIEDILSLVGTSRIERFLFPIGNDFFHFDNAMATTTAGTPQDADGRYPKVFQSGFEALIWGIDTLAKIAPVDCLWIPGNHDFLASYHVCRELSAWYRNAKHVTFDCEPKSRKYYRYGTVLLGFMHGDSEKIDRLPQIMATEVRDLWGATTHHEIHLGHRHTRKKKEWISVDTFEGCSVRTLPSLCGTDAWHFRHGFIGARAAESYLWSKDRGYLGHFSVNVRENEGGLRAAS